MNIASVTVMTVPPARINNLVPGEWGEAKPPLNIAIARAGIGTVDLQLIGEKGGYTADGRGYTYNSLTGFKKSGIDSLDMRSSPAERLIPTGVEHGQELDILV